MRHEKKLEYLARRWHHITNTLATPLLGQPSVSAYLASFPFAQKIPILRRLRYRKPPLSFDEQLAKLEQRGLVVADREVAMRWLSRVNYYRLSAYLYTYRVPGTDNYKPGTTFQEIAEIYNFDRRLRMMLMDAIERIEVWLRTAITYELAHTCGAFGYLNQRNFEKNFDHKKFVSTVREQHAKSKEAFVKHYRGKYTGENDLPIWMATELLTIGTVSVLYGQGLALEVKRRIAVQVGVNDAVLTNWLQSLAYTRNLCAHHSRVWNRHFSTSPKILREWGKIPQNKLYGELVMLDYLLERTSPNSTWRGRLIQLINSNPRIDPHQMGFPKNWRERLPFGFKTISTFVDSQPKF